MTKDGTLESDFGHGWPRQICPHCVSIPLCVGVNKICERQGSMAVLEGVRRYVGSHIAVTSDVSTRQTNRPNIHFGQSELQLLHFPSLIFPFIPSKTVKPPKNSHQ